MSATGSSSKSTVDTVSYQENNAAVDSSLNDTYQTNAIECTEQRLLSTRRINEALWMVAFIECLITGVRHEFQVATRDSDDFKNLLESGNALKEKAARTEYFNALSRVSSATKAQSGDAPGGTAGDDSNALLQLVRTAFDSRGRPKQMPRKGKHVPTLTGERGIKCKEDAIFTKDSSVIRVLELLTASDLQGRMIQNFTWCVFFTFCLREE